MDSSELTIDNVTLIQILKNRNIYFYNDFIKVYRKIEPLLNSRISQVFQHYTLHNVGHSLRIMNYMEQLVPNMDDLSDLEIVLLAYSALLHDIGMAASKDELEDIKQGKLIYGDIKYDSLLKKFEGDELKANQDYIRRVHAFRSSEFIKKELKEDLIIPNMINTTFEDQVALICQSHTEDIGWIDKNLDPYGKKGDYTYNSQFCAIILRLADILDFDSQRTPPKLFESISPNGISKNEWVQHFSIENTEKIKQIDNGYKLIELHGRCSDAFIHRRILNYIDWINEEIDHANGFTQKFPNQYKLLLHPKVYNLIKSEGHTIADMKFKINYNQITKLLMGEQLYGDKKQGLRELIQNALDACKLRKEILDRKMEFGEEKYRPIIKVILDKKKNEVTIKDNGIGMDINILKNYFLKLGASFYNSDDYLLKGYTYKPIGNYGIGFLACFMLSDAVKIRTRHYLNPILFEVELTMYDEYVCINHNTELQNDGTEVILKYDQFMKNWENFDELKEYLNTYFLSDGIEIQYINKDEKEILEVLNPLYLDLSKNSFIASDYLIGIDGQISINFNLKNLFINTIDEIRFVGEPYIYDGEKLISIDNQINKINPLEYINDYNLQVLNIPIIEYWDELEKYSDVLGNEDGIDTYIDTFEPNFISIIATKELMENAPKGYVTSEAEILPNLKVEDLSEEFDHHYTADTTVQIENKLIYHNNNLFLPIRTLLKYKHSKSSNLFIRGIFVTDFNVDIPFQLENLSIKSMRINVTKDNIVANVTRNDLNRDDLDLIKKAIYQAICFYLYENIEDQLQKEIIFRYLKKYHGTANKFLKENYNQLLLLS